MSDSDFISQLQRKLTQPLPGRESQRISMPGLTYGRHQGPAPRAARQAAVVVMLMRKEDRWMIPVTMRPLTIKHHGGQISLPGGRIEVGESSVEAALREFEEELGLSPVDPVLCGELSPLYVYASDNSVQPIVMACQYPSEPWRPDKVEVAEIIELAVEDLRRPDAWQTGIVQKPIRACGHRDVHSQISSKHSHDPVGHISYRAPGYCCSGHRVWGATGMILAELVACLP
ncbi:putative NUDIX hydrolase [Roseimaritima multifibrata]|uniref:Putative NUDIX hydrolase n=1 Tax=Roseimaritima multifibrata TaxID=1930274 RepID=A0A517MFI7_9BACT|nr:CoA pyrophosphatase [Roseimaritima multifibrata]QDS93648.1 putative NUDIX hydrolase [Roseimaritima multifibrata]